MPAFAGGSGNFQRVAAPIVAPAAFPDASNTGPDVAGYTLTNWAGSYLFATDNQVVTGQRFVGVGPQITGANVIFRGCEFQETFPDGFTLRIDGLNARFEDCRWRPITNTTPPITRAQSYQQGIKLFTAARGLTVLRSEFYGFGNAIEFEPECSQSATPILVKDCWMHDAADQAGSTYHHDGVLSSAASQYVTVDHCAIVSGGNTNAIAFQTPGGGAAWDHITVTNSLLGGFGYTVNLGDDVPSGNVTFTDNVWTTLIQPNFGPFKNTWANFTGVKLWARNKILVPAGSFGDPTWDGKFWWPDDSNATAGHLTDFAG